MAGDAVFSYDAVAYPSAILPMVTPARIGGAGYFYGWEGPDPETCSYLEIGCGDGASLLGLAQAHPGARFVGMDLSGDAIARGQTLQAEAGITNVDLHRGDIMDYQRDGERFDYIVAHGVYAWVPPPVQPALLELIAARLAPGGIAYVSHDCLPATAAKLALNRFFTRHLPADLDAPEKVEAAFRLAAMLSRHQHETSRIKSQITQVIEDLPRESAFYVFHDQLSQHYNPASLRDIAVAAAPHRLAVVGDPRPTDLHLRDLDDEARAFIEGLGQDIVARGEALDMMRGVNMFRRTLFAHADAPPPPAPADRLSRIRYGFVGTRQEVDDEHGPGVKYEGGDTTMVARSAPELPVMEVLAAGNPHEFTLQELVEATGLPQADVEHVVATTCATGLVLPHAGPSPFVDRPGEKPLTTSLIRTQMGQGDWSVTLRHAKLVVPSPPLRRFLALCDGTRTREDLSRQLSDEFGTEIPVERIEAAIEDMRVRRVFVA